MEQSDKKATTAQGFQSEAAHLDETMSETDAAIYESKQIPANDEEDGVYDTELGTDYFCFATVMSFATYCL